MAWYYTARQRFSAHTHAETWAGYQQFSGFQHIEELVSADAMLCTDLIDELVDEDWQYNVHADGRVTWFTDLHYLLYRCSFDPSHHNTLALYENPRAPLAPPDGFVRCGYDILDGDDAVSVLTNCGQFPTIFAPTAVNRFGLLPELAVAQHIAEQLRHAFPDDPHCQACCVWQVARYQPADGLTVNATLRAETIAPQDGRNLFGADVQSYDQVRPPYPEQLYTFLQSTGALHADCVTLEIGAGNGLATRRLLELGANPLTALEPDPRFAPMLHEIAATANVDFQLIHSAFEEAMLPLDHYDLVAAATAFHWIDPTVGLTKVATLLKPGGYAALWWNVFGDPERPDPFHDATQRILRPLSTSPSDPQGKLPFALDSAARLNDFAQTGQFDAPIYQHYRWTLTLNTAQVGALYGTFSGINQLSTEKRERVLEQLMAVAATEFRGKVARNMVTAVYVARRQ